MHRGEFPWGRATAFGPRLRRIGSVFMKLRNYLVLVPLAAALAMPAIAQKSGVGQKPRLAGMDQNAIAYIRPGITVKVISAGIAQDGTITTRVKIADPKGIPLDMDGINTAGPVTLR